MNVHDAWFSRSCLIGVARSGASANALISVIDFNQKIQRISRGTSINLKFCGPFELNVIVLASVQTSMRTLTCNTTPRQKPGRQAAGSSSRHVSSFNLLHSEGVLVNIFFMFFHGLGGLTVSVRQRCCLRSS